MKDAYQKCPALPFPFSSCNQDPGFALPAMFGQPDKILSASTNHNMENRAIYVVHK